MTFFLLEFFYLIFFTYISLLSLLSPTLSRSSPPLYLPNFYVLSLKMKKKNNRKKSKKFKQIIWKTNRLKRNTRTKSPQWNKTWNPFCCAIYCWAWAMPWNVADVPTQWHLNKENWFLSPCTHWYQTASWLGAELCLHFPFSVLGFCLVWACTGIVCAAIVFVSSLCLCPVLFRKGFILGVNCHFWLVGSLYLLLTHRSLRGGIW